MSDAAYYAEYRRKNKTKLQVQHKKWREQNKDKIKTYGEKYRAENKVQISVKMKDRRRRGIDKSRQQYRMANIENFLKRKLGEIKRKKRYECEIDLLDLLGLWEKQHGKCAMTGKKMEHKFRTLFAVSVDRIDSAIGYLKGNVQLVCQGVNFAKNDYSSEDFLYFWHNPEIK